MVALALLFVVLIAGSSSVPVEDQFKQYLAKHGKVYGETEYHMRLRIFSKNIKRAEQLSKASGAEFSVDNQFGDMSPSEFKMNVLMNMGENNIPQYPLHKYARIDPSWVSNAPASFDWREKNAVNPVRDQGTVGTCWAFSTTGNIEGQMAIHHNLHEPLSVEQIVECDASVDRPDGLADCGMFGGWPSLAYEYIKNVGGIRTEKDYPYCIYDTSCWPCMASGYDVNLCGNHKDLYCDVNGTLGQKHGGYCFNQEKVFAKVVDWKAISRNETEIAASLANIGPLSVLVNADPLQSYKSGIYTPSSPSDCNPKDLDHAVLLVGYGTESGKDFWIVKNSWGSTWGESGYFRIARGVGACGINTGVTTSVIA